jgi:hypothetical protein
MTCQQFGIDYVRIYYKKFTEPTDNYWGNSCSGDVYFIYFNTKWAAGQIDDTTRKWLS